MRLSMLVTTVAVLATAGAGTATASPLLATRVVPAVQVIDMPFLLTASVTQQTAAPQPSGDIKVDVNLGSERTVWYTDPLWVVIGVAAVIVIVALVAMAARGGSGGTTVIR